MLGDEESFISSAVPQDCGGLAGDSRQKKMSKMGKSTFVHVVTFSANFLLRVSCQQHLVFGQRFTFVAWFSHEINDE